MKISIAMATYNGEKYLQAQLDSFVAQTRQPDELIITDDCSSDDSVNIIARFAEIAPFEVRWEVNENDLGYAENFNKALMMTTGDIVFLSDQDDVWYSNKIYKITECSKNSESLLFMNDLAITDSSLNDTGLTTLQQIRSANMSLSSFRMGCSMAIKRGLLDYCLPIPKGYPAHDGWLDYFAECIGKKEIVHDVLQLYRRHDDNVSNAIYNDMRKLNRWRVYIYSFKKTKLSKIHSLQRASKSTGLLISGLKVASQKSDEPLSTKFNSAANILSMKYRNINQRVNLLNIPRWKRIPSIFSFWLKHGYDDFSDVRSVLSDVLY